MTIIENLDELRGYIDEETSFEIIDHKTDHFGELSRVQLQDGKWYEVENLYQIK